MAGGPDERVRNLYWDDETAAGNPTEEGECRRVGDDVVAYLGGEVKSFTELPTPTAEGAMFYSDDGASFIQIVPLVGGTGMLFSDDGKIVYEG